MQTQYQDFEIHEEPVSLWNHSATGADGIMTAYSKKPDDESAAILFQQMIILSYLAQDHKIDHSMFRTHICERNLTSAQYLFIDEMEISHEEKENLKQMAKEVNTRIRNPHMVIILDTDPETCYERIKNRTQVLDDIYTLEDLETIDDKLQDLEQHYKDSGIPVFVTNEETAFTMICRIIEVIDDNVREQSLQELIRELKEKWDINV